LTSPQFPHHFLKNGRIPCNIPDINLIQHEPRRLQSLVVARDAIAINDLTNWWGVS
jgi:hypothetical protein